MEWEAAYTTWKTSVTQWERMSQERLPEGIKVAIILEQAPVAVRPQLALAGHTTLAGLEQSIVSYLGITRYMPNDSSHMEVDFTHD